MKKGDIWISAVIYMALGVIILALVLTAGIPVINKIKDKNLAVQTKDLMNTLDKNIREVYIEGPGSKRPIQITIERGTFTIDETNDDIKWSFDTSFQLSEIDTEIKEGNLIIKTTRTSEKNKYLTELKLDYTNILDITTDTGVSNFAGTTRLVITNLGAEPGSLPEISIEVV